MHAHAPLLAKGLLGNEFPGHTNAHCATPCGVPLFTVLQALAQGVVSSSSSDSAGPMAGMMPLLDPTMSGMVPLHQALDSLAAADGDAGGPLRAAAASGLPYVHRPCMGSAASAFNDVARVERSAGSLLSASSLPAAPALTRAASHRL